MFNARPEGGALSSTEGRSQSRPTLWRPPDRRPPSVRGLSRQESRDGDLDLPAQGANPGLLPRKADSLPPAPPGKTRGPAAQPRSQTLREGADLRARQEGFNERPPHCRLPACAGGLCLAQPFQPLLYDRAFSLVLCTCLWFTFVCSSCIPVLSCSRINPCCW